MNINVSQYLRELETIIIILKEQLISKYFNHSEKLQELKSIMKINGPRKNKKELNKLLNIEKATPVQQNYQIPSDNEISEEEIEIQEDFASTNSLS